MVRTGPLRIVFFGTPGFALSTFDSLLSSQHEVVSVVTRADRPRGRGQRTTEPPIKVRAIAAGIPVLQPDRLQDHAFLDALKAARPDLGVVVAYGKILTDAVLATPVLGLLNVHASLLPKYRGAAPVHRAVIAGEQESGVTIMRMVRALDAGPMLASARRAIHPDETSVDVERDLAQLGAELLMSMLGDFVAGTITGQPQDESAATYAPRLSREDGVVDWHLPAAAIHNLVRGLHPWPHAFTFHSGHRLILLRSSLASSPGAPGGTVVEAAGNRLVIAARDGAVALEELRPEGKRSMTPREFLAGHRVSVGDRLTPTA